MKYTPQEIEVWYLLPALRKELAERFIAKGLKQKEAAVLLGITEAAISQYKKEKRGHVVKFSGDELKAIDTTAQNMIDDRENGAKYLYELSVIFRGSKTLCTLHKEVDQQCGDDCTICNDELVQIGK